MHMFFVDQEKLDGVLDVVVMQKYIQMIDKRGGFLMGIPLHAWVACLDRSG